MKKNKTSKKKREKNVKSLFKKYLKDVTVNNLINDLSERQDEKEIMINENVGKKEEFVDNEESKDIKARKRRSKSKEEVRPVNAATARRRRKGGRRGRRGRGKG
jgi:hypothetical protein